MESSRYAFAGPQWLAALHATNLAMASEFEAWLGSGEFSMCETYTGVPTEVAPSGTVAWTLRVAGGDVRFAAVESDDVQLKVVADWKFFRSLVVMPMSEVARMQEMVGEGMADGRISITGDMSITPPFAGKSHDSMASITE